MGGPANRERVASAERVATRKYARYRRTLDQSRPPSPCYHHDYRTKQTVAGMAAKPRQPGNQSLVLREWTRRFVLPAVKTLRPTGFYLPTCAVQRNRVIRIWHAPIYAQNYKGNVMSRVLRASLWTCKWRMAQPCRWHDDSNPRFADFGGRARSKAGSVAFMIRSWLYANAFASVVRVYRQTNHRASPSSFAPLILWYTRLMKYRRLTMHPEMPE